MDRYTSVALNRLPHSERSYRFLIINIHMLQFDLLGSAWLQVFLSILSPLHLLSKALAHRLIGLWALSHQKLSSSITRRNLTSIEKELAMRSQVERVQCAENPTGPTDT